MPRRHPVRDSKLIKICAKCKKKKPISEFYNITRSYCILCNREHCRQYAAINKQRRNKRLRDWRKNNPEKVRILDKRKGYRRKYGLSIEQVEKLKGANDYKCWICNKKGKRLVVDHDHNTGKVRGMLCDLCNRHLGYFENMDFKKMKQYLDQPCHADILLEIAND